MQFSPYLNFKGQCEEAFKFYEQCLGGKIEGLTKFLGSPMAASIPKDWQDKVMHAALKVGSQSLMGTDPPPDRYQPPQGISVALSVKTPEEAERVFNGLAAGGKILMPMQKTFWSARFGMTVDRFGIPWMVNCEQP